MSYTRILFHYVITCEMLSAEYVLNMSDICRGICSNMFDIFFGELLSRFIYGLVCNKILVIMKQMLQKQNKTPSYIPLLGCGKSVV